MKNLRQGVLKWLFYLLAFSVIFYSCDEEELIEKDQEEESAPDPTPEPEEPIELTAKIISPLSEASFILNQEISFEAEAENAQSYSWEIDEVEVSTALAFTHSFTAEGVYNIVFTAFGEEDTLANTITLEINESFFGGALIINEGNMTSENGSVTFLERGSDKLVTNLYASQNEGQTLSNVTQTASYFGDHIYFVSQNGPNYIIKADKHTLKTVDIISKDDIGLEWPSHLVMIDETKGYIRDVNGVHVIDFVNKKRKRIGRIYGEKSELILLDGKVFTHAGSKLRMLDVATDSEMSEVDFGQNIGDIVKSTDDQLWIALGGSSSKLIKVSTSDYSIIEEIVMPEGVDLSYDLMRGATSIMPTKDANKIFVRPIKQPKSIYVVEKSIEGTTVKLFADLSTWGDEETSQMYGQANIDPVTNDIYLSGMKGFGADYQINALFVVDGTSGAKKHKLSGVGSFPSMTLISE